MRNVACFGLAIFTLLADANASMMFATQAWSAEDLHYDPSACKDEAHGRMYIALDRNVLSVPLPTTATVVGDIYPGMGITRLTPPDAKQPLGCPDNPLQLQSYAFNYVYEEGLNRKWGIQPEARPRPDLLDLINNNAAGLKTAGDEWIGETTEIKIAQRICSMATVHEHLLNGLEACRVKPVQKNVSIQDWGASYTASPDIYATPTGRPFVVYCGPGLYSRSIGECDVAYRLRPGLDVTYRFQPFRGPGAIPIEHIIDFDRDLRQQITAALVKDYVWPK